MTFVRYTAIQLLAYSIDMGAFLITLSIIMDSPISANVIAKFAAGLFAFFAHRHFTFRAADGVAASGQAIKYFFLLALNIPLASAILALLLMWFHEPVVAKFISDVICVGFTYVLSKHFIFTAQLKQASKSQSKGVGA